MSSEPASPKNAPLQGSDFQLDVGGFEIHDADTGAHIGNCFVEADSYGKVEHWVLFEGFRHPGPDNRSMTWRLEYQDNRWANVTEYLADAKSRYATARYIKASCDEKFVRDLA
ncbi:MAG: hypothetical protein R3B70_30180 [Polyangiaceae bacterium]